jgi:hypothetical protein
MQARPQESIIMKVHQHAIILKYGDADPQQAQATKISSNIVQIYTCGRKAFRIP